MSSPSAFSKFVLSVLKFLGILKFLSIIEQMKSFTHIEFGWKDIVRSDFVRDYIMTKEMLKIGV